jgi:hypothetical protein
VQASTSPLQEVDVWLERVRRFWTQRLDALGTELARGAREDHAHRPHPQDGPAAPPTGQQTAPEEDT